MADLKISQLATESPLSGTEDVEIVTGGINKKTTTQDIADLASGGVSSVNGQTGTVDLDAGDLTGNKFNFALVQTFRNFYNY